MSSIALHDNTGKRLIGVGCVSIHTGAAWRSLVERIAAEYGIPDAEADEAIRIEENADGIERCIVDGRDVGYVATEIDGIPHGHPERLTACPADPTPSNDNVDRFTKDLALVGAVMSGRVSL